MHRSSHLSSEGWRKEQELAIKARFSYQNSLYASPALILSARSQSEQTHQQVILNEITGG